MNVDGRGTVDDVLGVDELEMLLLVLEVKLALDENELPSLAPSAGRSQRSATPLSCPRRQKYW